MTTRTDRPREAPAIVRLRSIPDPVERATAAHRRLASVDEFRDAVAHVRDTAIRESVRRRLVTNLHLAEVVGISRQSVHRIVRGCQRKSGTR